MSLPRLRLSFWFWCIAFSLITLDKVAVFSLAGFNFKLAYFFFAGSVATAAWDLRGELSLFGYAKVLTAQLFRRPWVPFLLLLIYAFVLQPWSLTPKKSFGYGLWLIFDLLAIAAQARFLALRKAFSREDFLKVLAIAVLFFGAVILVDEIAYYAFGYRGGWIGFNQDAVLQWGMSRPHAFSYEPSFIALYLSLALVFLFAEASLAGGKLPPLLTWSALTVGLLALIATTARTGWVNIIMEIAIATILALGRKKRFPKKLFGFFALAIFCAGLVVVLMPKHGRELIVKNLLRPALELKDVNNSGSARLRAMAAGYQIGVLTHGIGTGLGASYLYWMRMKDPATYGAGLPKGEQGAELAMSTWAELAAELGLPGLLLYLAFAISFCQGLYRAARKGGPYEYAACAGAFTFFLFSAHFYGNPARSDVWVWYAIWSAAIASPSRE